MAFVLIYSCSTEEEDIHDINHEDFFECTVDFVQFVDDQNAIVRFETTLEDLTEEQSKIGSAGLVMAIVGSALLPKLQGIVIDFGGRGVADILILGVSEVNFSFLLPFLCFFYLSWYGFRVSNKNTISP